MPDHLCDVTIASQISIIMLEEVVIFLVFEISLSFFSSFFFLFQEKVKSTALDTHQYSWQFGISTAILVNHV